MKTGIREGEGFIGTQRMWCNYDWFFDGVFNSCHVPLRKYFLLKVVEKAGSLSARVLGITHLKFLVTTSIMQHIEKQHKLTAQSKDTKKWEKQINSEVT